VYLPLLLVVHCTLTYLRLWDRLMGSCVSAKYRFTRWGSAALLNYAPPAAATGQSRCKKLRRPEC
jgi:hypothetical protein